jgi:hypothetical protein
MYNLLSVIRKLSNLKYRFILIPYVLAIIQEEHSGKATDPGLAFNNILRTKYPGYSVIRVSTPFLFPLNGFPELLMRVSVS